MIADGVWKRNNATNYITCDDYDGKNTPKRTGLNLKKYFSKETSETPTYGPINIVSNGYSFMDFTMQISAVGVRESSSDKSVPLGTWKTGFDNNLTLVDPQIMRNYTADIVYRVVTVEVFGQKINFIFFYKKISSKNLLLLRTNQPPKVIRVTALISYKG